jgi:hypothetical protein
MLGAYLANVAAAGNESEISATFGSAGSLEAKVDEYPTEVVRVLFDPVVELLDLLLIEKTQYSLLQLSTAPTGNDLNQTDFLLDGFVDDGSQRAIDVAASVVDIVQIELQLHVSLLCR